MAMKLVGISWSGWSVGDMMHVGQSEYIYGRQMSLTSVKLEEISAGSLTP